MNVQHYRTWIGYAIPVQPDQPVEYGATRDDAVIYRGTRDDNGNLVSFTKRRRVREAVSSTIEMPASANPGERVFLQALTKAVGFEPGEFVEFASTAESDAYYDGIVGPDGRTVQLTLVKQLEVMRDEYVYDGTELVARTVRNPDGKVTRMTFDRGRPVVTA